MKAIPNFYKGKIKWEGSDKEKLEINLWSSYLRKGIECRGRIDKRGDNGLGDC